VERGAGSGDFESGEQELLSEIEESTYEREGELKIKLEKERVRGIEREMENFKTKKIKKLDRGRNSKKEGEGE
jgi:hypothetical protein